MLQLKNIKKDYIVANNAVHALKGVSLRFRKNEFVSILGASGCGKTTLLNIIGGLDHYTSGDLVINDISTKDYKDRDWDVYRNHRIGFVFQSYNLIPHQTVLGNVELALTIAGISKAERRRRAEEALCKVGLQAELHKRPNQLSGGQMQRVAIARALVNNPEILLADEPTGALDTTTSIQIMELIREIAGERLVIMVTHNPEIAEEYSSRIVRLQDGLVIADSNPYYGEEEGVALEQVDASTVPQDATIETRIQRNMPCPYCGETVTVESDGKIAEGNFTCPHCNSLFRIGKKVKYYKKPEEKEEALTRKQLRALKKANKAAAKATRKKEKKERSSMSFKTSLGLSARNLLSKKGRTALTSIAGSIGIISVCLVLALSNGFNNYILKIQEDMLSAYPITISKTSMDMKTIMNKMTSIDDLPDMNRLDDKVYVNSVLTNMAQGMTIENDLSRGQGSYVEYIENMDETMYTAMQYDYGMNIFSKMYTSVMLTSTESTTDIEEYRSLTSIKKKYQTSLVLKGGEYSQLVGLVEFLPSVIGKIPGTADMSKADSLSYVQSQYDKLAGEWPTQANEAVLVIGEKNEMFDLNLAQLGFISETEFLNLFDENKKQSLSVDFDSVLQKQYFLANNDAVYTQMPAGSPYAYMDDGIFTKTEFENNLQDATKGTPVKVAAILRLKDDLSYGCLSNGLNITEQLELDYIQTNKDSQIAKSLINGIVPGSKEITGSAIFNGSVPVCAEVVNYFRYVESTKIDDLVLKNVYSVDDISALQALGASDAISGISLYTSTFEAKDALTEYLDAWNAQFDENKAEDRKKMVNYTDTVQTLTMLIGGVLNAITYVLVAFTSISLVVSSVMIGIITYVSVVERTKEIGVLRSLGARKKDIKNLFNAETFIIGLTSGLFGVAVCYGLCLIVNAILGSLTGIATLASLPITSAAIMVCISVALTLISGLIPANAAAKKDPVIALRTE